LLLEYHYDANCILAEPIPNCKANSIVAGHKQIVKRLRPAGVECSFVMLDNECSHAPKEFFHSEAIIHQKTPAGMHPERGIRTWKNHFVLGLCTVHESFPLYLWDKLIQQAKLTLNLLRGS
jgi:hypothetical protein